MATTVVYDLIDRLLAILPAEVPAGTIVMDGIGVTDDPSNILMIGVEDATVDGFASSAEVQQSWAGLGAKARDEEGSISCYAEAWNGDGDLNAARNSVQAITTAVENKLRADPSLGNVVTGLRWVGFGSRFTFQQAQGKAGAAAGVFFQIDFRARI